jgi:hypothetical protein
MFKVTPNSPNTDPASPYEGLGSNKLNDAAERALDFHFPSAADIKATPRTPDSMFIVNPELSIETLLAHVCESLASANVMTMDLADIRRDQVATPCWALRKSSCWVSSR